MTKLFKHSFIITLLALMAAAVSCTEKPSQEPEEAKIELGCAISNEVDAEAGEFTIEFTANKAWTAKSNKAWITISPAEGAAGKNSITCSFAANDAAAERSGRVNIEAGDAQALVSFRQKSPIPAEFNMLFIGNSFLQDACWHLPGIVNAAGLSPKINMVDMYWGGGLVSQYNDNYANAAKSSFTSHTFLKGPNTKSWTNRSGKCIQDIVKERRWDVITIQEHTGNAVYYAWDSEDERAIGGLIKKILADCVDPATGQPYTPKLYFLMSQAYYDLTLANAYSGGYFKTQEEQYQKIVSYAQKCMEVIKFDGLIPSGTYFQNLRKTSLNKTHTKDLTRDGYHMDYGITRYGAACLVFEMLVSPKFYVTLENNTFRYNTPSTDGKLMTPVTDANAPIALQCARAAIKTPYAVTDLGL